jgi:hypothetical protein
MTFKPSSSNGARWRLIETIGVLFAVLKRRVLQKRHRPPPDKTSGHNFKSSMYPHEYKTSTENSDEQTKIEKNKYSQIGRLENPEELQLHHDQEKFLFLTVLLLFAQCEMHDW